MARSSYACTMHWLHYSMLWLHWTATDPHQTVVHDFDSAKRTSYAHVPLVRQSQRLHDRQIDSQVVRKVLRISAVFRYLSPTSVYIDIYSVSFCKCQTWPNRIVKSMTQRDAAGYEHSCFCWRFPRGVAHCRGREKHLFGCSLVAWRKWVTDTSRSETYNNI